MCTIDACPIIPFSEATPEQQARYFRVATALAALKQATIEYKLAKLSPELLREMKS